MYYMCIHVLCIHVGSHLYAYVYVIYIYVSLLKCTLTFHKHIHTKQFWLVCSMCQTYWAHAFLSGCARQLVTACSPLGSSVRLPTLFPTLVALLPALAHSAVLVRTHWHVRAPVLCNCGVNNVSHLSVADKQAPRLGMKHCTCNTCRLSLIVADACIQHLHVLHGAPTIGNPAVIVLGTCSVVAWSADA